ncbi:MAG: alkaline phosphatase family protein [Vicingaceae bacterium]|nr:MAG: alkaline phosphatase family protein [Vicingaceae bacterium]
MRVNTFLAIACAIIFQKDIIAQNSPKIVVGIVIDQMRQEYLYRYKDKWSSNGGFMKLINQGTMFVNAHYTYFPTYTAPGHASIYTGTTPYNHGIVANEWFDPVQKKDVYCVWDDNEFSVGCFNEAGKMSPRNLKVTTITDELKLVSGGRSKVFGVSLKDRGAILPAGHLADAAYWFDGASGNFITSTYYMKKLPGWVEKFNAEKKAIKYLDREWQTLLPIEQYTESYKDSSGYEQPLDGKKAYFPYDLKSLSLNSGPMIIRYTPWGNTLLFDFAKALIENEALGTGKWTDFLCISFSTPDYIGHAYGPRSVEIEDMYLRLDKELGDFLNYLEKKFGKDNVLVFLTADHGGAENTGFNEEFRLPGKSLYFTSLKDSLNKFLMIKASGFNSAAMHPFRAGELHLHANKLPVLPPVENISNMQIYLANEWRPYRDWIKTQLNVFIAGNPEIKAIYDKEELKYLVKDRTINAVNMLANGLHPHLSGDFFILQDPGSMEYGKKGTTHGSVYRYDTHVPLIFWGKNIPQGLKVSEFVAISDIAPTLSLILQTAMPSGATGIPLQILFSTKNNVR